MRYIKILGILLFIITAIFADGRRSQTEAFGSLKNKIQSELDQNPFLKKEGLKLRVVEEENGYVTIQVVEGHQKLRKGIAEGCDINSETEFLGSCFIGTPLSSIKILKKSVNYIRQMEGVKEVLLTASINTPMDRAEDLIDEALNFKGEGDVCKKTAERFREAAEIGHPDGQILYGSMYETGECFEQSFQEAATWYHKAVEQNKDSLFSQFAQLALGRLYYFGKGVRLDYLKAINWLRKSAEQGNIDAMRLLATGLATCPDPKIWNGKESIKWALEATKVEPKNSRVMVTLATAYARDGQFDKAIETARKTIELLGKDKWDNEQEKNKILTGVHQLLGLYEKGKPYTEGVTTEALSEAVKAGDIKKTKQLVEAGIDADEHSLDLAVGSGNYVLVDLLIKSGATVELYYLGKILPKNVKLVELLLDNGAGAQHGLIPALKSGNSKVVNLLADRGAKLEKYGATLRAAARGGFIKLVKALVKAGVDVNSADQSGLTALHEAAGGGLWDSVYTETDIPKGPFGKIATLLIQSGTKVDAAADTLNITALGLNQA